MTPSRPRGVLHLTHSFRNRDELAMKGIMESWDFKDQVSCCVDKNLARIIDTFLIQAPYGNASAKGKSLKSLHYISHKVEVLFEEMLYRGQINPQLILYKKADEMKETLQAIERWDGFEGSFQFVLCTKVDNRVNSILHLLRNALAHGAFKIVDFDEEYYAFENFYRGKVQGRAVLKTDTLLLWAELLRIDPDELYKQNRDRKNKELMERRITSKRNRKRKKSKAKRNSHD